MAVGFTPAQVRDAERPLLDQGLGPELMQRAAEGLARSALALLAERERDPRGARVLILAGSGNNGGDARIAGDLLGAEGAEISLVEALEIAEDEAPSVLEAARGSDLVIDGILGTGARPGLPPALAMIAEGLREDRGAAAVIAVDLPSGIGGTDGEVGDGGSCLWADVTVTFVAAKSGLLLPPACFAAGRLEVVDIGVSVKGEPAVMSLSREQVARLWPVPQRDDHKYRRGVLGLIAGSDRYPGAGVLAATAALEAGVGMLRVQATGPLAAAITSACPEAVPGEGRVQAWAMGPGDPDPAVLRGVLAELARDAGQGERVPPCVLDAGALDLITGPLAHPTILTPHAGELAQLLSRLDAPLERAEVEAAPGRHARRLAELLQAVVLLKGPATVVAAPLGPLLVQRAGTPWLATAGAGDVLTGLLGSLLAGTFREGAGAEDLPELARLAAAAAVVHGLAAGQGPVRARRLAEALGRVIGDLTA